MRTTLVRLAGLTTLAALLLSGLVAVGVWRIGEAEGERTAQRVSAHVATAVLVPLTAHDFTGPHQLDRAKLMADLAPFLDSGLIYRIKVWTVEDHGVRVAFSDEERIEAALRPFDRHLAEQLDAGLAVVREVPDDEEHRFEAARADDLREVFIGFRDAGGNRARLEIYTPVDVDGTIRHAMLVLLPLALLGVLLLAAALVPLAVAVARRIDRDRRERQEALQYGLAAAELARRDVAHKLHDDVVPAIASAGLLLDSATGAAPSQAAQLTSLARRRIHDNVRQLRSLLSELTLPAAAGDAPDTLDSLVAGMPGSGPRITLDVADDVRAGPDAMRVVHRVAGELLRNAVTHSGAHTVEIALRRGEDGTLVLTVADDGRGFDPATAHRPGHIGLLLVRWAVEDVGGTMSVQDRRDASAGTVVALTLPADGRVGAVRRR